MIVLIDAYNVLKQSTAAKHIVDAQRNAFIKKLHRYSDTKGHTVMVVFDGGDSARPTESRRSLLHVIYSGYRLSADDVLKNLCSKFKGLQVMLVSSDRELCSFAARNGIVCIEATAWYDLLNNQKEQDHEVCIVKHAGEIQKRPGHESSSEIDQLMQESARVMMIKKEDEEERGTRHAPSKKLSKAEKKIQKLVNKL